MNTFAETALPSGNGGSTGTFVFQAVSSVYIHIYLLQKFLVVYKEQLGVVFKEGAPSRLSDSRGPRCSAAKNTATLIWQ